MRKFPKTVAIFASFLLVTLRPSVSAARQLEIGARPQGMGETFLAIADDANAMHYNPAGLPALGHHEVIGNHADLFGIGLNANNIGYAIPLRDHSAFGLDWNNLDADDGELGFNENVFRLCYGRDLSRELSLGIGVRYIVTDMTLDERSLGEGIGSGFDVSALYSPSKRMKVGLSIRDVGETKLDYSGRGSSLLAEQQIRVGAAYQPLRELMVAADVDDELHLGAEYWHQKTVALRAGFFKSLETSEPATYSAGTSVRYKQFQFDYAYVSPPTLPATSLFSMSVFFHLAASRVHITRTEVDNLFPAFQKQYTSEPIGSVKLENRDDKPHQTTVSFFIPELMDFPTESQVVIRPKETLDVDVMGVFSKAASELTEDILTQAEVKVSYAEESRTRSTKKSKELFVYNRNATRWDDLRREAAFITSTDPVVAGFARPVMIAFEEQIKSSGRGSRNLLRAMVLFEAINQYGIRYVADPNNPYSRVRDLESAVDNIQYPAEVLTKKSGDCDDLTACYCSLLENVGVATALIDAPGHIFMMFDTGVTVARAHTLPLSASLYVVRDGRLWIPVEITLFGKPFTEAWKSGAEECARLAARNALKTVTTAEAWELYEPSPPRIDTRIQPPTGQEMHLAVAAGSSSVRQLMEAFIERTYLLPLRKTPEDDELRFQLAQIYTFIEDFEESLTVYQRLETSPGANSVRINNNKGITYFLQGDVPRAVQSFRQAMQLEPGDARIRANFEMATSKLGREAKVALADEMGVVLPDDLKASGTEPAADDLHWIE